ncbi:hypothetical protein HNY42_16000 (plasmid) [Exiguobacterium sp. Helios]|uniref:sigma factor-like helix-turn-helix DNA-binding protein n=1 Tax=Exiguobacterium sp. Helios TaxID=2735868 RepID=UPI00165E5197|nr:sigma factor-like helix-turn-helix DNA-binding protein [Exiguobacterium sp. Helios]QNR22501.1 hypothetical protein HNY42_16000 [Exiguobacterium sp. Helios]
MSQDDGMIADMRMLGLLDLADAKASKLSMSSVLKVMEEGYNLEDFMSDDEEAIARVRANTRRTILELLKEATSEEIIFLMEGKSLYRLALADGGVSEQIVRNLLIPSGLKYGRLEGLDYDMFRQMTGGGERQVTFAKLIRSYKADGGGWSLVEEKQGGRSRKIGVRQLKKIERDLTILYDDMTDQSTVHGWATRTGLTDDEARIGLESLVQNEMLEIMDDRVVKRTKCLMEALEIIPEIHRTMLQQRLSGMTLQEIGEASGITRERVRQVVMKSLVSIPLTHVVEARRMRYLYENYDLDAHFFERVLLQTREVFHFMFEKCPKGVIEKRAVYSLLRLEERKRMLLSEGLYEDLNGEASILSKAGLVEKYYALRGRKTKHVSIHHQRYLAFIEDELYGRKELLEVYSISERAFEGLSHRTEGCLKSAGHQIRYLDLDTIFEERVAIEELFVLNPGIYNTRLIYDRNLEYFESLDIRNHHELHNIMKDNLKIESIQMRRMPEFGVEVTKKLDWLVDLIDEMGPIQLETFLLHLEEIYGLSIPSTRSLIQAELSDYITSQNDLAHDIPELSVNEEEFIRSILTKDVYTLQELDDAHGAEVDDFRHRYLNKRNLSIVGYDLRWGLVIRKELGSGEKYFRRVLLSEDYFRRDDSPAQNTRSFWNALLNLQESLDLFCIEEEVYMNILVLERAGIRKRDVADFRSRVVSHFSDGRYYTMKNIRDEIEHPLLNLWFDDIFYERICRSDAKVRFIPVPSGDVFYQARERRNQIDFIGHLSVDGIQIDDLRKSIEHTYGIVFERAKVIEKINSSNMYYTPEMERVYLGKQSFLDTIYGIEEK